MNIKAKEITTLFILLQHICNKISKSMTYQYNSEVKISLLGYKKLKQNPYIKYVTIWVHNPESKIKRNEQLGKHITYSKVSRLS